MTSLPGDPKLLSYLQEYVLECSLCHAEFKSPKTLDCLHTFCLQCIDVHISQTQAQGKLRFACPTCKCEQTIPDGGAQSLDSSYVHQSIQSMSKVVQSEGAKCTCCAKYSAQTACYDCGQFLCSECDEKHRLLNATKDHSVCPMRDLLTEENLDRFHRERYDTCAKHTELKNLFCRDCEVPLCNMCVYDDKHQNHDVTSMLSKVDDEIQLVEKKMEALGKDKELHQTNIVALQNKLESVETNKKQVLANIEENTRLLHEMIENYKTAMIGHVTATAANQRCFIEKTITTEQTQLNRKEKLRKESAILKALPLASILPTSGELSKKVQRLERSQVINGEQLEKSNPAQNFIGQSDKMNRSSMEGYVKFLVGHVTPLPDRGDRSANVPESDMKAHMQQQAIDACHAIVAQFGTYPRNYTTFKAMAKALHAKWMETHQGDWKVLVGVQDLSYISGFGGKKKHFIRIHTEGFEFLMLKTDNGKK